MFEHERPYKHTYETPEFAEEPKRREETPYYFQKMDVLGKKAKKEVSDPKTPLSHEKQTVSHEKIVEKPKEIVEA